MDKVGKLLTKSMTILDSTNENRFFEGYLTVEMKDKQGEITMVDELYKVLPIWVDRGAPITDTHSNRVIGKGINFAKTTVESEGVTYPAIKITGKIHKNYELDTDIWDKIRTGEYRGLSFGGATKSDRVPKIMKDGSIAYALTDLEHYEVAVCKDPAVPLAIITDYNPLAKATIPSEPRGDGKEVIKCDKFGCYVNKGGEDWSNADGTTPATVTNTVSQSTQIAKPVKIDTKVGEIKDGVKTNVVPLEGGLKPSKKEGGSTATSGTGGGVRAHPQDAYNQDDPDKQTSQNSQTIIQINQSMKHNEDINKVLGAIAAGAARVGGAIAQGVGRAAGAAGRGMAEGSEGAIEGATDATTDFVKDEVEENVQPLEPKEASAARIEKKEAWDKDEKVNDKKNTDTSSWNVAGTGMTSDSPEVKDPEMSLQNIDDELEAGEKDQTKKIPLSRVGDHPFKSPDAKDGFTPSALGNKHRDTKYTVSNITGNKDIKGKDREYNLTPSMMTESYESAKLHKAGEDQEPKHSADLDLLHEAKSGYETTDADMTLGGQAVPKEKEKPKKECSECDADVTFVDHNEGNTVTWDTRRTDKAKVPQKKQYKTDKEKIDWKGYTHPERADKVGLKWTEGIGKAWENWLDKKHEWDHLSKDPDEDKKIQDEIDDSGNN
jgi:hypothetical protein